MEYKLTTILRFLRLNGVRSHFSENNWLMIDSEFQSFIGVLVGIKQTENHLVLIKVS